MGQTAHDHQWLLPGIKVQEVWPQFLLGPKMARSYWKMIQGYQIFQKFRDSPVFEIQGYPANLRDRAFLENPLKYHGDLL